LTVQWLPIFSTGKVKKIKYYPGYFNFGLETAFCDPKSYV